MGKDLILRGGNFDLWGMLVNVIRYEGNISKILKKTDCLRLDVKKMKKVGYCG